MSALMPFTYEGNTIRTIDRDGEPWFVAKDIAEILGYSKPSAMIRYLDDDEKGVSNWHTLGGDQELSIISESGLYSAILRSRVKGARKFKRWVTREVLPAIRQHGGYLTPAKVEEALLNPDTIIRLATDLKEARAAEARAIAARDAMECYAKDLEPRADAYDSFMSGDGTYSIGSVAKMIGLSQNKLFAELRNRGVLITKGAMRNTPYQQYMHHFAVKAYDYQRSDGSSGTSYTPRVQPSGIQFIRRKLGIPAMEVPA